MTFTDLQAAPAISEKSRRIAIVDFGLGNMRSLAKAVEHLGGSGFVTTDPEEIVNAEKAILPGDGAFGRAMENLNRPVSGGRSLADAVVELTKRGKPLLGICVGMQVLLSESEEFGHYRGLDIVPGEVKRFPGGPEVKVPQIGWNNLTFAQPDCPLFEGLESDSRVYFIHSYYCEPSRFEDVAATTRHGIEYCSVIHRDTIYATQFHPEKSGSVGLKLLENFIALG